MSKNILAVDIGSTKICSIIAEIKPNESSKDRIRVIGTGHRKSHGVKKGLIGNIEQASRAIQASIDDAKRIAGVSVDRAIISLSDVYTKSANANGQASIHHGEITIDTINAALATAMHKAGIPGDSEVIHVLPYRFKLDEQDYVDDPIGMTGVLLSVDAHIVFAKKASLSNLKKAVELAGVEIQNIVLSSYAASIAVLEPDERELGIVCVDMGGDTCDLMIYDGNSMRYNDSIRFGSSSITKDIAGTFNTPLEVAEKIKIDYGALVTTQEHEQKSLKIPTVGNSTETNNVDLTNICAAMQLRAAEILAILAKSLQASGIRDRLSGVVLTGGMVKIKGMRELAGSVLSPLSVRIAQPVNLMGLFEDLKSPSYAVAVGLILYGAGDFTNYEKDSNNLTLTKHYQINRHIEEFETQEEYNLNKEMEDVDLANLNRIHKENNHENDVDKKGFMAKLTDSLRKLF